MKVIDLNKQKNSSCTIHGKSKAYRIIIDDDEAFEVVHVKDPELTKKDKKQQNLLTGSPKELILFSVDRISISEPVHITGIDNQTGRPVTISEVRENFTIAQKFKAVINMAENKK